MNVNKILLMIVVVLLGMVIVVWFGVEYCDEVKVFLCVLLCVL